MPINKLIPIIRVVKVIYLDPELLSPSGANLFVSNGVFMSGVIDNMHASKQLGSF